MYSPAAALVVSDSRRLVPSHPDVQTYAADIFMSQSWRDSRLKIPAMDSNSSRVGYRQLPLKWLDRMWRPDSFFKNAKQVVFQEMTIPNHYIWLYPDTRILYMVK